MKGFDELDAKDKEKVTNTLVGKERARNYKVVRPSFFSVTSLIRIQVPTVKKPRIVWQK